MGGITHEQQFIRVLKEVPAQRLGFHVLTERLADRRGEPWTTELVERKARELDADPSSPIFLVRDGVQYFGSDIVRRPALYKETARNIERSWAPENGLARFRSHFTARPPLRGTDEWCYPDLVLEVRRRADADRPIEYHAIEIEQPEAFGMRAVYQAHEQARGADYSWVFYCGVDNAGPLDPRIKRAAKELGVGVVRMPRPTVPTGWRTELTARARDVTPAQRSEFLTRCDLADG